MSEKTTSLFIGCISQELGIFLNVEKKVVKEERTTLRPPERFKRESTYSLLCCVLGVSFRSWVTFFAWKATFKSTTKYLLLPQLGPEEIEFKN